MKKIAGIHTSPRSGWNTDLLLQEATKGKKRRTAMHLRE